MRLGYSVEELLGSRADVLYVDLAQRMHLFDMLQERKRVQDYEMQLRATDGRILEFSLNCQLVYDADYTPTGIQGLLHDITAWKESERALRDSSERFRPRKTPRKPQRVPGGSFSPI